MRGARRSQAAVLSTESFTTAMMSRDIDSCSRHAHDYGNAWWRVLRRFYQDRQRERRHQQDLQVHRFAVSRLKAILTYRLAGGIIPFIRKYSTICP